MSHWHKRPSLPSLPAEDSAPVQAQRCPPASRPASPAHVRRPLPVPVITRWIEGKPDFRPIDAEMCLRLVRTKCCAICSKPLDKWGWYVGGDLCLENGFFHDPPMHRVCALESMRLCPFLSGPALRLSRLAPGVSEPTAG